MDVERLVTVVALCYNQGKYVVESLESIKTQTIKGFDFHIIDDCSIDDSVNLIESWIKTSGLDVKFHKHEKNQGITKSMNHALRLCKTKYFQPWPCDDNMLPHKLESQITYLESLDWTPGFLYGDCQWMDEKSVVYRESVLEARKKNFKNEKMPVGNVFPELVEFGCFIPTASGIYVTDPVNKLGGFDENLWAEDIDMFFRISLKYGIAFKEGVVSSYRRHPNSSESLKGEKYWNGHFQTYVKYFGMKKEFDALIWKKTLQDSFKAYKFEYSKAGYWLLKSSISLKNLKGFIFGLAASIGISYKNLVSFYGLR